MLKVDDLKSTKMSPWGKYMPMGTKKFGDSNVYGLKSGHGRESGDGREGPIRNSLWSDVFPSLG